ncbi:hypothetical protein GGF40_002141 [Coemansia sp. RSA 1286]|nr:hypothetical protein GGF39_002533 [Coemansia sp. RSA 1721]KAJ2637756.1 hypothetical protein GGF40_002141 [Coemansia sp. RSA 1286]
MPSISSYILSKPSLLSSLILARRLFGAWYTRDAADIIRDRAALPAVKALDKSTECMPIDPTYVLKDSLSCNSHFGYQAVSKVNPLAYAWSKSADFSSLLITGVIPPKRMPSAEKFDVPMVTLIDHINENVSGHPGLIHGGMTTVIAHSSMSLVAALNAPRAQIVPRTLNMDYRKPIRTGNFVKIHAWLYEKSSISGSAPGVTDAMMLRAAVHFYSLENELLVEAISDILVANGSRQGVAQIENARF